MARKHNTKHNRGQSRYPERLRQRGVSSASVRMETIEALRKRQGYVEPVDLAQTQHRILRMEGY